MTARDTNVISLGSHRTELPAGLPFKVLGFYKGRCFFLDQFHECCSFTPRQLSRLTILSLCGGDLLKFIKQYPTRRSDGSNSMRNCDFSAVKRLLVAACLARDIRTVGPILAEPLRREIARLQCTAVQLEAFGSLPDEFIGDIGSAA